MFFHEFLNAGIASEMHCAKDKKRRLSQSNYPENFWCPSPISIINQGLHDRREETLAQSEEILNASHVSLMPRRT